MIKLNNKNITYVALADSNNSVKGVKEIWYADSNNSVKLVYRRKDALIEGEDYEKYHWLIKELTNTDNEATYGNKAVIDTLVNFTDDLVIEAILNNADRVDNRGFGIITDQRNNVYVPFLSNNDGYFAAVCKNRIIYSQDDQINIAFSLSDITINGVTTSYSQETLTYNPSVAIGGVKSYTGVFYYKTSGTQLNTSGIAKYGNFIFRKGNSVIMHLIPCKLLKPVPKWLDANGIRRQVGECGMIDLVSGKFYGNVNSVGTFTVENYYERKEWLVGDGSAYIRTGHTNNENLDWEVKVANFTDYKCLFWQRTGEVTDNLNTVLVKAVNYYPGLRIGNKSSEIRINPFSDTEITVSTSNDAITINGQTYQVTKGTSTIGGNFALFYTAYSLDSTTQDVCCAYFRFLDSNRDYIQNLIPCTLTMDLPASMDANNIARTKGTSGMWDLVSDRFYGNVANSGTFKAVNLAEGVDYEVHQWLIIPYTQNDANKLPINSNNINYKYLFYSFGNVGGLVTQRYTYYFDGGKASIWSSDYSALMYRGSQQQVDTPILIDCSSSGLIMGGDSMPNYGLSPYFEYLRISCYTSDGRYALSSITVDGSVRYIPVKLLKSIPSKYDANGIARQAGECGMYDTVNDVFYGNVASSGSFTVSDDN